MKVLSGILLSVALSAPAAKAAVLDFSGSICGGAACTNGQAIDQSYGDIAGQVDVVWDSNVLVAGAQNMLFWDTSYSNLTGIAYGAYNEASEIFFMPSAGTTVTLSNFALGAYFGNYTTALTILDGLDNILFDYGTVTLSQTTASVFSDTYSSAAGIKLRFGPYGYVVGIDNIQYSTSVASPVPLPASALLLVAGLGGLAALRRQKGRSA